MPSPPCWPPSCNTMLPGQPSRLAPAKTHRPSTSDHHHPHAAPQACPGGAVLQADHSCACPSGTTWSGTFRTCVSNNAPPCSANDCQAWDGVSSTCTPKTDGTACTSNGNGEAPCGLRRCLCASTAVSVAVLTVFDCCLTCRQVQERFLRAGVHGEFRVCGGVTGGWECCAQAQSPQHLAVLKGEGPTSCVDPGRCCDVTAPLTATQIPLWPASADRHGLPKPQHGRLAHVRLRSLQLPHRELRHELLRPGCFRREWMRVLASHQWHCGVGTDHLPGEGLCPPSCCSCLLAAHADLPYSTTPPPSHAHIIAAL